MSWLTKQFLKRGPGSPGSIAKVACKKFVMLLRSYGLTQHEANEQVLRDYLKTYRSMGMNINHILDDKLVDLVENNIVYTSFALTVIVQNGDRGKYKAIAENIEMIFDILNERLSETLGAKSPLEWDSETKNAFSDIFRSVAELS